jgi:hypothetical protein
VRRGSGTAFWADTTADFADSTAFSARSSSLACRTADLGLYMMNSSVSKGLMTLDESHIFIVVLVFIIEKLDPRR